MDGIKAKITGSEEEIAGLNEALAIHVEVEERMKSLASKGAQSETAYLSQKLNRQEVELKINNLRNQILQLRHDSEAAGKRMQRVQADRHAEVSEKIVETKNEIHVLRADLDKAARMKELAELRVPTDLPYDEFYVLEASERTTGSVVRETDPLFKLMPLRDPLRIEAQIAGKDIGEVRLDDPAIIKLDALPYQKHGTLKGHLATISEGSFEKKEGMTETAYFKAYVTIDDRTIQNQPVNFRPVPGMTCKVELRVGQRRVIDYFLYPLFRHLDESLREPSQRGKTNPGTGDQADQLTQR
jgi:HlyD family secretion protein